MTENTSFFAVNNKHKIKLRTPGYIYARLLLIYTVIYTLAFAGGCFLFHFLDLPESRSLNSRILSYFSVNFSNCNDIFDASALVLSVSKSDIYHLLLVFSAGFTMLSGLIISSLLIFRGFSLGFSLCYLICALREHYVALEHPTAALILYSITCAIISALLLHSSVKSAQFCDEFKALCGNPRKIIRSKALYSHIFLFLIVFGAFLILNLIRCIL